MNNMEVSALQNRSMVLDVQWNFYVEYHYEISTIGSEWEDIDTSKHPFPAKIWVIKPAWEVAVKILSLLPIVIIGSVANSGLIYVVVKKKFLRTTTNLLIVNMCIADLGTCVVCPWMFLCIDLFQKYVLGEIGCRLDGLLVHALTLVAVFNLSAISYDRVSAIVFNCSGHLSKRVTYTLLFATWISAAAVAAPLAYFRHYYERQWKNYSEAYCTEDTVLVYPYWHIFASLSVWAPLAIMAISYSAILIKLDRYESQALRSKFPIVVKYKGRVAQVLALIVLAFIVCRVPFTALIIRRAQLLQGTSKPGQAEDMYPLWYISRYLVLVNAAINPLLYGCSSSSLRKELALCSVTSWFIRKKKEHESKPCSISQLKSDCFHVLRPRSPCIRMDYNERGRIPNSVSTVTRKNLNSTQI